MPSPGRLSDTDCSKSAHVAAVVAVAVRQHGVVTIGQLLDAGFTRRMVQWRVRTGWLHQVHVGLFAVGCPPTTREAHWMAAVLACGPAALLSHAAAAAL